MRNTILLNVILLSIPWVTSAQTFTTLSNSQHVFFLTDSFGAQLYPNIYGYNQTYQPYIDSTLLGFRIDSIFDTDPNSTTYFFNKMHRFEEYSLAIQTCESSSFMGESMTKSPLDGIEIYYNGLQEPIVYKNNAQLGESWLMFDGEWGTCVARLDSSINLDTILGQPDTVFSIICEIEIFDFVSTRRTDTILVGRNSGLIKMYSHYLFPFYSKPIYLCGTSYPVVGLTSADEFDYHNFNIGDEFHAHEEWGVPNESYNYRKEIYKILDREENDSCVILYREVEICLCWNCSGTTNYSNHLDTVKIRKYHRALLPFENGNVVHLYNGKLIEEQRINFGSEINQLANWGIPKELAIIECIGSDSDWPGGRIEFEKGLGLTNGRVMLSFEHGGNYQEYKLTYYSKNDYTEGIPFDLSECALGTQENELIQEVSFVPNPSHGSFFVKGIDHYLNGYTLEIRNSHGKVVYVQKRYGGQAIENHTFPAGLYFVSIYSTDQKRLFTDQLLMLR